MTTRRWVHVVGDGQAYTGRCLLHSITLDPDAGGDEVTIYDGRDAASGRKFMSLVTSIKVTRHIQFEPGMPFSVGIFVDGSDAAVETTVVFTTEEE